MTEIDFHFNTPDKVSHACRLLRKAVVVRGKRVVVAGHAGLLDAIDLALWQTSPADFVTHCRTDAEAHVALRSAVLLTDAPADAQTQHRPVLVNLGDEVPVGFERFERLVEIVTDDEADRQRARLRWRHYAHRGYVLNRFDLGEERA